MQYIFDLDHTVIDSSHRQLTIADGSLDLAHWVENCTREKIFADSLLPLATEMRDLIAKNRSVIVCTARVMSDHDRDFLVLHGLNPDAILSRPVGDNTSDHLLKERLIREYCAARFISFARFCQTSVMFDDNQKVNAHLANFGINTNCAIRANKLLTSAA